MGKSKLVGAAALSIGLLGGGIAGAIVGVPGLSSAQEQGTTTTPGTEQGPSTSVPPHHKGEGFGARGGVKAELSVVASTLGMSEQDLRTALQNGSSIADVASQRGVPVQSVIDAVVSDLSSRIDARVSAGSLDSAKADQLKAELPDRVSQLVQRTGFPGRGGAGPHHRHG
jgi:hypothetical protein